MMSSSCGCLVLSLAILVVSSRTSVINQGTVIDLSRRSSAYYPVVEFTPSSGDSTIFEANSGSNPPTFQ